MRHLDEPLTQVRDADWRPRVQVKPDFYSTKFEDWDTWARYFWAIRNVMDRKPESVLEIGVGTKVVNSYLKRNGAGVTSVDIDPALGPDFLGSVTALPFEDNAFDAVLCLEVIEHMPWEHTRTALSEIYRVTKRYAFISTPHFAFWFALLIRLPLLQLRELRIHLPYPKPLKSTAYHAWELGRPGYPVSRLRRELVATGFKIVSEQGPRTNYSGRFFILEK